MRTGPKALAALLLLSVMASGALAGNTTLVRTALPRGVTFADITARGIDVLAANRDGTYDMVVTGEQLDWLRSGSPGGGNDSQVMRPVSCGEYSNVVSLISHVPPSSSRFWPASVASGHVLP